MFLEDGAGTGYKLAITKENRLLADVVTASTEHHANIEGNAYNAYFAQSPTANDDCIFYLVNSDVNDMIIEGVTLYVSGACEIYFKKNDKGTRNSGSAITPVNLNFGSGNEADVTCEQGVDLDGGAATLTGGTEFDRIIYAAASSSSYYNFEQDIIIPKGVFV